MNDSAQYEIFVVFVFLSNQMHIDNKINER
jgi:hypothetical protein